VNNIKRLAIVVFSLSSILRCRQRHLHYPRGAVLATEAFAM
jgi:hypothetical protein